MKNSRVSMLLSNPYKPDDRVRIEAQALRDGGFDVTILAWDRDGTLPIEENVEGINILRAQVAAGYEQGFRQAASFLKIWLAFFQQLRITSPHIIHCHDFDTLFVGLAYRMLHRKTVVILDAHENYSLMIKSISEPLGDLLHILEKVFTRFADMVIAPCHATLKYYQQMGARHTAIIGNWKDPVNYTFSDDILMAEHDRLGIGNQLIITYIGSLSAERQVLPLIDAIRNRPDYFLILGGSGGQEQAIRAAIKDIQNIFYPGYIHPDAVPLLTAISDIIFYGHVPGHPYGLFNAPNKLYEALAAGKAVLASDLGGELSEVMLSVGCGILLKEITTDSIASALNTFRQGSMLSEMQAQSRQAGISIYNWSIARHRLLDVYASLML